MWTKESHFRSIWYSNLQRFGTDLFAFGARLRCDLICLVRFRIIYIWPKTECVLQRYNILDFLNTNQRKKECYCTFNAKNCEKNFPVAISVVACIIPWITLPSNRLKQKSKTVAADAKKLKIEVIVSFIKKLLASVFSIKSSVCHSEDSLLFEILVLITICPEFLMLFKSFLIWFFTFYHGPYNHSILKNYHRYCSALEFINQYIFKKPMQSEKTYYRRIAGFFNAGRPVATPAGNL